jgi:hypothetical protein
MYDGDGDGDGDGDHPATVTQRSRASKTERGLPCQGALVQGNGAAGVAVPLFLALDAALAFATGLQRRASVDGAMDGRLPPGKACPELAVRRARRHSGVTAPAP